MIFINGEELTERRALIRVFDCYQKDQLYTACSMIKQYGVYDFWEDFTKYLEEVYPKDSPTKFKVFSSLTIAYNRIMVAS